MSESGVSLDPAATLESPRQGAPEDTAPPEAWLVVVHSPDRDAIGVVLRLGSGVLAVGRDVDPPGLSIRDAQLSRLHFRIAYDGRAAGHRFGDAQSTNGTFLDGKRMTSAVLRAGTVLRAGETVLVYREQDPMERATDRLHRVAPTVLTVLLVGETGTGKERLARAAHDASGRTGAFVALNCGALPRELLGAELFGHTRGAFSGADGARLGLFQAANGGTLFLDEVGDFPLDLQAVLLRALQEGTVRPLGADAEVPVDARIVAATHLDLATAVAEGKFRGDLYARLAQAVVRVPLLRDRRWEVLALARDFAAGQGGALELTADAAEALVRHDYPFNVRQLQSLVRAFVVTDGGRPLGLGYLTEHHPEVVADFRLPLEVAASQESTTTAARWRGDRSAIEGLLIRHAGNVSGAASEIGKPRAQLYRWLREVGLDPSRFRRSRRSAGAQGGANDRLRAAPC